MSTVVESAVTPWSHPVADTDWPATILPHHRKDLERSGIRPETARAAGVYSEIDSGKLACILDWRKLPKKMAPALVFPFTAADGRNGYARIKPDHPRTRGDKLVKYESPKGRPNEVYLPPGVAASISDPRAQLLLTEGEKKALGATQAGLPCLGLVGVYGWKDGKREALLPVLERIAWRDRPVFVVFDSDAADNPDVQDAEARLGAHLTSRGAKVRAVRLPHGPADADGKPTKMGLDDFLVAHGAVALQRLLDAATEPAPPDPVSMKAPATDIDPGREAVAFLEKSKQDGIYRLRFWRGSGHYWLHGAYREVPNSELRGRVANHLDQSYSKVTIFATSNVLDMVKAKAMLPHSLDAP